MEAMARPWKEIKDLQEKHHAEVIVAGDLFDRWNQPPEMINWALDNLPHMLAIPGNHDLPAHRFAEAHRSAYGTLVRAGRIKELTPEGYRDYGWGIQVHGFPFGTELTPPPKSAKPNTSKRRKVLTVAVIHEYLWTAGTGHMKADPRQMLFKKHSRFDGWDVVIVGDNHMRFTLKTKGGTTIYNCGTLLRRKANEADYRPCVGLIRQSGKVEPHYLDISKDVLTVLVKKDDPDEDHAIISFVEELVSLQGTSLSFRDALIAAMEHERVTPSVRAVLMRALDNE